MKKVEGRYPVFSYGSNNRSQLEERVNGLVIGSVKAYLKGHIRIFAGASSEWNGGVASVLKTSGGDHSVKGSVFYLTQSQLERLDTFETGYERQIKKVIAIVDGDEVSVKAFVYIKTDPTFIELPSGKYLSAVQKTVQENWGTNEIEVYGLVDETLRLFGSQHKDGSFVLTKKLQFPKDFKFVCGSQWNKFNGGGGKKRMADGTKKDQVKAVFPIFSYGSNTIGRLRETYGDILNEPLGACLNGYTRIFCDYSGMWQGAIASVLPQAGSRVHGAVIFINEKQLKKLDRYEAVGVEGWYSRETLPVQIGEENLNVFVYIKEDVSFQGAPSAEYMKMIRTLLKDVGFDKEAKDIPIPVVFPRPDGKPGNVIVVPFHFKNGKVLSNAPKKK
jgi:gamma-glutamylcyclotransferase (GGCT)/AIG2-like uncharacterized protein YtfP